MTFRTARSAWNLAAMAFIASTAIVGAQLQPASAGTPTIAEKLAQLASTPAAANAREQFGKFATSPEFADAAKLLLTTQDANLTQFQKELLSLVPNIQANAQGFQGYLAGRPLSLAEQQELNNLRADFRSNPAIRTIAEAGQRLQFSHDLSSVVQSDAAGLTTPTTTIPPGSGVPQVDAFDGAEGNFATAANLPALAPALGSIMTDPAFPSYVQHLPPLAASSLLPGDQLWKLLLLHDHDPSVVDWVDYIGGSLTLILGAVAGILGVLGVAVAVIVTVTVVDALIGLATLTFHFLATIDCDHDGDPWDSADVAGNEC